MGRESWWTYKWGHGNLVYKECNKIVGANLHFSVYIPKVGWTFTKGVWLDINILSPPQVIYSGLWLENSKPVRDLMNWKEWYAKTLVDMKVVLKDLQYFQDRVRVLVFFPPHCSVNQSPRES